MPIVKTNIKFLFFSDPTTISLLSFFYVLIYIVYHLFTLVWIFPDHWPCQTIRGEISKNPNELELNLSQSILGKAAVVELEGPSFQHWGCYFVHH